MMKPQTSFDNDPIRHCLVSSDRNVDFEPTQLTNEVLARVKYRRKGIRRMAGAIASLFAMAWVGIAPMWLSRLQEDPSIARRQIDQTLAKVESTDEIKGIEEVDLLDELSQQHDRLRQLNLEISRLRQIEVEQELVLTGESLSRTVIAQFEGPYPVFIGE